MSQLGTAPDKDVANRIGRTPNAVRIMRGRLGLSQTNRIVDEDEAMEELFRF